ncbi:DUF3006 domain-containing protein [Candidatus Clostridium stratigraminis]|uniref:DUF3006 domain-containing protein n=1 Tax=Candidatus Clostridium stratigraminis TaxID=3381661 RepID=A0ABW8T3Z3_9CLOT
MVAVIDRFEEGFAVCEKEDGTMINIKKFLISREANEGDVLIVDGDSIKIGINETLKRKKEIEILTKDLWEE